ncbi:lectin-like [Panicum virgatum]|uniref:lectin-like n=1 Tax=Panicum virgatum TaxID=38727 RepID=UPI0019D599BD|nr:lectin-like [Panicum virgatum]
MGDYAALAALAVAVACALMASAATPARAQQCGQHAGGMLCPNNLCCSRSGRCGLGADYCGAGCQSGACCPRPRAPATSAATRAASAASASSTAAPGRDAAGNVTCGHGGATAGWRACPGNLCCGHFGRCSLGVEFCGDGCHSGACCEQRCGWQAGGDACTNGYCCGRNGYCGLGGDYCGTGCQSGQCLHAGGGAAARAVGELLNRTASAAGTKASLPQ